MKVNTTRNINIEYDGTLITIEVESGVVHFRDLQDAMNYLQRTLSWWTGVHAPQQETLF